MRILLLTALLFTGFEALADTRTAAIKTWKTFQSNLGYEFKYPDCWKIKFESSDEDGPPQNVKEIFVEETSMCPRPKFSKQAANGIGFSGGYEQRKSSQEADKELEKITERSKSNVERKEWLVFKRFKLGSSQAIAWVEVFPGSIRWEMEVYCADGRISMAGPIIDDANVSSSLKENFKRGDLALPEPEKTLLESVRCIPAKKK